MKEPLFTPQTEWLPPTKFPDLRDHKEISIDLETKDPQLKTHGSGSIVGRGQELNTICSYINLILLLENIKE